MLATVCLHHHVVFAVVRAQGDKSDPPMIEDLPMMAAVGRAEGMADVEDAMNCAGNSTGQRADNALDNIESENQRSWCNEDSVSDDRTSMTGSLGALTLQEGAVGGVDREAEGPSEEEAEGDTRPPQGNGARH